MASTATAPYNPWPRGLAWLLLLGPLFFISYGYANGVAAARGVSQSLYFAWERQIPFLPWTILPYWSIDLFYGLSFLCCASAAATNRHALRLLGAQLISVSCFLLWPLRFAFERPAADGLFGQLFDALASFDQPYNQAPSLHISLLVLIWSQFARLPVGAAWQALVHGWALLIGLSVLTTWQHHFIDLPSGAAVGLLCLWLWPDPPTPTPLRRAPPATPAATARRRQLAARYAGAAVLLLALTWQIGAAAGWLAWPALALALVAWCYGWCGTAGFQKQAGRHTLGATLLLLPCMLGAWLNARCWTRRHPAPDLIADGVWLGRLPTAAEMRQSGCQALCDLSAELPAPRGPWHYAGHPWLDLVPPSGAELLAAARDIEALRRHGPVQVACALGYSRGAAAVVTWLRLSGRAASMPAAVAQLQARRPQVVLDTAWLAALAEAETLLPGADPAPTAQPVAPPSRP